MPPHKVYKAIVHAVMSGRLKEPFTKHDFRVACPQFKEGTYNAFLWKHRKGNGKTSDLFEVVKPGQFRVLRPFKYGLRA